MAELMRSETQIISELCTHKLMEKMFDDMDIACATNVIRKLRKLNVEDQKKSGKANKKGVDVAEAYSPPRMTTMASKLGYTTGFSLDLTI